MDREADDVIPVADRSNVARQTPELARRRAAVAELGRSVRRLVDAVVATEAEVEMLELVAEDVQALAVDLAGRSREPRVRASVDDISAGVWMYSPVSGEGNPLSPPVTMSTAGGETEGRCILGRAFEGPPLYAHGGVSALLLDHVLSTAAWANGEPGMTTELTLRYRRPVPLATPLLVRGVVAEVTGRRTRTTGGIASAEEPERVLVEADLIFTRIKTDSAHALFPA